MEIIVTGTLRRDQMPTIPQNRDPAQIQMRMKVSRNPPRMRLITPVFKGQRQRRERGRLPNGTNQNVEKSLMKT